MKSNLVLIPNSKKGLNTQTDLVKKTYKEVYDFLIFLATSTTKNNYYKSTKYIRVTKEDNNYIFTLVNTTMEKYYEGDKFEYLRSFHYFQSHIPVVMYKFQKAIRELYEDDSLTFSFKGASSSWLLVNELRGFRCRISYIAEKVTDGDLPYVRYSIKLKERTSDGFVVTKKKKKEFFEKLAEAFKVSLGEINNNPMKIVTI